MDWLNRLWNYEYRSCKWLMLQTSICEMKSEYLPSLKPTNRHGKSSSCMVNAIQTLVDFGKYQSVPSLNLTPKHFAPENRSPITSHHQFLKVFAVRFREYFWDFRGRIAWLKIRCSEMRALNGLWKIACLMCLCAHLYTYIHFWRFDSNIGNTPIFHWTESLFEEKSYSFHVAPFLQQQGFLHPTNPPGFAHP